MPLTRRQRAARDNPWVKHLRLYRSSHPRDPNAMQNARRSYRVQHHKYRGNNTNRNNNTLEGAKRFFTGKSPRTIFALSRSKDPEGNEVGMVCEIHYSEDDELRIQEQCLEFKIVGSVYTDIVQLPAQTPSPTRIRGTLKVQSYDTGTYTHKGKGQLVQNLGPPIPVVIGGYRWALVLDALSSVLRVNVKMEISDLEETPYTVHRPHEMDPSLTFQITVEHGLLVFQYITKMQVQGLIRVDVPLVEGVTGTITRAIYKLEHGVLGVSGNRVLNNLLALTFPPKLH